MTEKEKAKAYDEAIERAKKLYDNGIAEEIFPELNEDERIKKDLIQWIDEFPDIIWRGHNKKDVIAWLEKQGKNSTDKIEPKFNVGDWVVNKFGDSYHIDSLDKKNYQISDGKGNYNYFPISQQDKMHLWTIQDAKDGNILACNEEILLFKSYSAQGRISLYCWYNGQTNNFYSKEAIDILLTTTNKVCPATKEQRNALMKAIKDAGYEWDAEMKELKYDDKN